ncbi:hypothetical protein ASE93_14010 [Serratia sp. Leaf50]|nr:hypothetical protein ASE93_14010 [Serratia sp. Leaf50]
MPLIKRAILNKAELTGRGIESPYESSTFVRTLIGFIDGAVNSLPVPVSFSLTQSPKAFIWKLSDGAFALAISLIEQIQSTAADVGLAEYPSLHQPLLASLNHYLRNEGYALSSTQLLGPASTFLMIYPLMAKWCGHSLQTPPSAIYTRELASYLAGACEFSMDTTFSHNIPAQTLTWQSDGIQASALAGENSNDDFFDTPNPLSLGELPSLGLPDTRPAYGPISPTSSYRIRPDSTAVFIGRCHDTLLNRCHAPPSHNVTRGAVADLAGANVYVHIEESKNRALYAISTGGAAMNVNSHPTATASLALPSLGFNDPLLFPVAESAEIAVRAVPWASSGAQFVAAPAARSRRSVINDGALSVVYRERQFELSQAQRHALLERLRTVTVVRSANGVAQREELQMLNILADDGSIGPLFAPDDSLPDCLNGLNDSPAPASAKNMGDLFEQVNDWMHRLPVERLHKIIQQYVHDNQSTGWARASMASGHNPGLLNVITTLERLVIRQASDRKLYVSPEEENIFITLLLADSPFDKNEELRAALMASPIAEFMLAKLLLSQLDRQMPVPGQLLAHSYQQIRRLINGAGRVTFSRLDDLLNEVQELFKSQVISLIQGEQDVLPVYLTRHRLVRMMHWHKRLMEFEYPFMALRSRVDLRDVACLSREGLMMSLGVRRLNDRETIATASRKELAELGQDLLLNNSPEALLDEFAETEALFTMPDAYFTRGIKQSAYSLKREGVLVIQFLEAKRRLAAELKTLRNDDSMRVKAYQNFLAVKRGLYALALETIALKDRNILLRYLQNIDGVDLQFVRMVDSQGSGTQVKSPYVGFFLSCGSSNDQPTVAQHKTDYFISLMPIQSDTTQGLAFNLTGIMPVTLIERENFLNHQGKNEFLVRLSGALLTEPSRYRFNLESQGKLYSNIGIKNWTQTASSLAREITQRQFVAVVSPILPSNADSPASEAKPEAHHTSWFARLLNELIYLTPLGSCKDAVVDLINAHIGTFILDGAFCLYAFFPAGSEEEEGLKTVGNVIKNVLKKCLEDNIATSTHEIILTKLDSLISEVEEQMTSGLLSINQVRHRLTANLKLVPLLAPPAAYATLALNEVPQSFQPYLAWRDPLHDNLYFIFNTAEGQKRVYRLDEHNKLLMPNHTPSLLALIERAPSLQDSATLRTTLSRRDISMLRRAIYQRETMDNLAQYSHLQAAEISAPLIALREDSAEGPRYYPAQKRLGNKNIYIISPNGMPEDQWIEVAQHDGKLRYRNDNTIHFSSTPRSSHLTGTEDVYTSLLDELENVPAGWRIESIWIEQQSTQRIVVGWQDAEGKIHYRHPDGEGRWLLWDSQHRGVFCQTVTLHNSRQKRNDPLAQGLIAELFSPEHCRYLTVPHVNCPARATALEALTRQLKNLAEPVVLNKIACATMAKEISQQYTDIWETVPEMLRRFIINIGDWKVDVVNVHEIGAFSNKLFEYAFSLKSKNNLSAEQLAVRDDFMARVSQLITEYQALKEKVSEQKRLKEEFKESSKAYFETYISRNLKANHWLNRWLNRIRYAGKAEGNYVIKAATPEKIARKYPFLHRGIISALTNLNKMATTISEALATPDYLTQLLSTFFNADFSTGQVHEFNYKIKKYLDRIASFKMDDIVVVADRMSEGKLVSGCFKTPVEKLIYGDGAYSFVYNSNEDKSIYLFDYLSNSHFLEFALAHELGHLVFDDKNYVFQEEIYLKPGSISKNFSFAGAARLAKQLMIDKEFFIDYLAKNSRFAYAFYRHFYAHSNNYTHKRALRNYYNLFWDKNTADSTYLRDNSLKKRSLRPLVDYLYSQPDIKLSMAYYNPDIFCGLFQLAYERAQTLPPSDTSDTSSRVKRHAFNVEFNQTEQLFINLLLKPLYEKHLQAVGNDLRV